MVPRFFIKAGSVSSVWNLKKEIFPKLIYIGPESTLTTQTFCRDASWCIHIGGFYWIFSFFTQICGVEMVATSQHSRDDQMKEIFYGICGACLGNPVHDACYSDIRWHAIAELANSCPHLHLNTSGWWNYASHHAEERKEVLFVLKKTTYTEIHVFIYILEDLQKKTAKLPTLSICFFQNRCRVDWSCYILSGLELIESIKEEQASSTSQEIIVRLDVLSPKMCGVYSFVLEIGMYIYT